MASKIRKGDDVIVLAGKDKGKRGTVLQVLGERVVVENINLVKKHVKPNPNIGEPGGIQSELERCEPVCLKRIGDLGGLVEPITGFDRR